MNIRLDGKVAVITGGGHGMGRAGVVAFTEAGARVAVVDRRIEAADAAIAALPEARRSAAVPIACDVTDEASVAALVRAVLAHWGRIDILWNCVGGILWQPDGTRPEATPLDGGDDILSISVAHWEWQLRLNLGSVFLCSRAVIPSMAAAGGGVILSMATGGALDPHESGAGHHPYNVAKSGVVALSRLIARDYGRRGIRSNVIIPGTVDSWPSPQLEAHAIRRTAAARIGRVDEVAAVAVFLASDAAAYISGEEIRVDGGSHVYGRPGYAAD